MTEEPYQIPHSWAWTTLQAIGDIFSGGTPKTSDKTNFGGDIPWITPADLTGYKERYIGHGKRNLTIQGLKISSAKLMPAGTVLFSSRAPIGYTVIASNNLCTNQGFKSIKSHCGIENEYVYYYLKGAKKLAENRASGTTFPEISGNRFAKLPIPIPPSHEQQCASGNGV